MKFWRSLYTYSKIFGVVWNFPFMNYITVTSFECSFVYTCEDFLDFLWGYSHASVGRFPFSTFISPCYCICSFPRITYTILLICFRNEFEFINKSNTSSVICFEVIIIWELSHSCPLLFFWEHKEIQENCDGRISRGNRALDFSARSPDLNFWFRSIKWIY